MWNLLAGMPLLLLACSSAPIPPICSDAIYGAAIAPAEPCLPPLQVWVRENALFDGQICGYAAWYYPYGLECPLIQEVLATCPLPDGYSSAVYNIMFDFSAGGYLWRGAVRVPSGQFICDQTGGGMYEVVDGDGYR